MHKSQKSKDGSLAPIYNEMISVTYNIFSLRMGTIIVYD